MDVLLRVVAILIEVVILATIMYVMLTGVWLIIFDFGLVSKYKRVVTMIMALAGAILVIFFIVLILLIVIGFWFPRGKKDWPLSQRATLYLLISGLFLVLILILINFASQHVNWADIVTSSIYLTIAIFVLLVLLGLFFPDGLRQYLG